MVLTENHDSFQFIFDNQLQPSELAAYKILILPNVVCLSDAAVSTIDAWVRDGGILILTESTGSMDEWGENRKYFANDWKDVRSACTWGGGGVKGKGQVRYFSRDPGLQFLEDRNLVTNPLVRVVDEVGKPYTISAPFGVISNAFIDPVSGRISIHFLNVSRLMNGYRCFRATNTASVAKQGRFHEYGNNKIDIRVDHKFCSRAENLIEEWALIKTGPSSWSLPAVDKHTIVSFK
jgi:hypothetical protein